MFLKHSFNHSNSCCEQALKESEIRTQTTTLFRHSLRWTEYKKHMNFLKIWLNNSTNSITSFTYY